VVEAKHATRSIPAAIRRVFTLSPIIVLWINRTAKSRDLPKHLPSRPQ
jgi:hypothetical protein